MFRAQGSVGLERGLDQGALDAAVLAVSIRDDCALPFRLCIPWPGRCMLQVVPRVDSADSSYSAALGSDRQPCRVAFFFTRLNQAIGIISPRRQQEHQQ